MRWPALATPAGHDFARSWAEVDGLLAWVSGLAARSDQVAEHAHEVLVSTSPSDAERDRLTAQWKSRTSQLHVLAENRQLLMETLIARQVDNFLAYVSSLLFEIFTTRSETLRSSDTVEVASVLKHSTIDDLVQSLAERKVERLSRESLDELLKFFDERLGMKLASENMRTGLSFGVELRNLIVHHRCVVNKRFADKAKRFVTAGVGTKYELGIEVYRTVVDVIFCAAIVADRNARQKFKLRAVRRKRGALVAAVPLA